MREIKFRAWNTILCRYSYFTLPQLVEIAAKDPIQWHILIIEQYTGLKDRNGVEIYEGGIVSNDKTIFAVEWNQQNACFWLNPQSSLVNEEWPLLVINCAPLGNGYYSRKDLAVIGNIHTKTDSNVQP